VFACCRERRRGAEYEGSAILILITLVLYEYEIELLKSKGLRMFVSYDCAVR